MNLFRITWKNEPKESGGLFGTGNWIEFPPALTGVEARIVGLVGKWFPTSTHKVGAAFGCLAPTLGDRTDSTRRRNEQCGHPREITAGAARSTVRYWRATRLQISRRR